MCLWHNEMEYFSCRGPGGMGPVRGGGFGGGRGFGGNRGKKDTCLGSILDIPLRIGLWKRSFVYTIPALCKGRMKIHMLRASM